MPLKISTRSMNDVVILGLDGWLVQGEECSLFRDSLKSMLANGKTKIVLDMTHVNYIDSSGVGELTVAHMTAKRAGGSLRLWGLTKKISDLLQVTRLITVFDVFDDEGHAVASFTGASFHCCCPVCGSPSGPPVIGESVNWPRQVCRNARCQATFAVRASRGEDRATVKSIRFETYKDEYFELLTGPPFTIRIVGRLDRFSSPALRKSWQAVPAPRRVIVELGGVTEVEKVARKALIELLAECEKEERLVVCLEGLGAEQVAIFPLVPPFYEHRVTALAALGDVSESMPLHAQVLRD